MRSQHKQANQEQLLSLPEPIETTPASTSRSWFGWYFWVAVVTVVFGGVGYTATTALLRLPNSPDCVEVFWPLASASQRLYCARQQAKTETLEGLVEAIALVDALPQHHPLRPEVNEQIAVWVVQVMELGDIRFQQGDYEGALRTATQLPPSLQELPEVKNQVQRWQQIWSSAREIIDEIVAHTKQRDWQEAYRDTARLTQLDNYHLATAKYEAMMKEIASAREDSQQLQKAVDLAESGEMKTLLEAIAAAQELPTDSYFHGEAREFIAEIGDALVELAREDVERHNWREVLEVTRAIPRDLGLEAEVESLEALARAGIQAKQGTISGLKRAITRAELIETDSPIYDRAQESIAYWQREIEDVERIEQAQKLARSGTKGDLKAAIALLEETPQDNPRYSQSRGFIADWTKQVQILEDRPILDRAVLASSRNSISAWQEAISIASRIERGRPLYSEAREKIYGWRISIERTEDQPILDRAIQLGNAGQLKEAIAIASQIGRNRVLHDEAQRRIYNWRVTIERAEDQPIIDRAVRLAATNRLEEAIATAAQIRSNRVLYREARSRINAWQAELDGRENLRQAYRLADRGTSDALAEAIELAGRAAAVPNLRGQSLQMLNRWSDRLWAIARERSVSDLEAAIEIAEDIPSQSRVYRSARGQIELWRQQLEPPEIEIETVPITDDGFNPLPLQ